MINDDFGDRMKEYEMAEAGRKLMPTLPIIARLDGRSFSKFTKGMRRPYDPRMSMCMCETTKHLVAETNACMGYTQSDEITLAWHYPNYLSKPWFDGRIQKMTSQLAAQATIVFNRMIEGGIGAEYAAKMPTFDARVWNVPNRVEGANAFLWREQDATKNSINMAAHHHFGHKKTMHMDSKQKLQMLADIDVLWDRDYPAYFTRGTYVQRRQVSNSFESLSESERAELPEKHHARLDPTATFTRSILTALAMPPFGKVTNRSNVIFEGHAPIVDG